jgi:hypothetical protein
MAVGDMFWTKIGCCPPRVGELITFFFKMGNDTLLPKNILQ